MDGITSRKRQAMEEDRVLTQYLNNFLNNKLEFQQSAEEVSDIKSAVSTLVKNVMEEVKQRDEKFKMADLIPFGDMADGTKIIRPDEFKFMVVLKDFSKPGAVKAERFECENWHAFTHVRITDENTLDTWSDFCDNGTIKSTLPVLNVFGYSTLRGTNGIKYLREDFSEHVQKAVKSLLQQGRPIIRSHGNMSLDVNVITKQHCASTKLSLNWHSAFSTMKISVDLVPVIEIRDINDIVSESDTFAPDIYNAIQETGRVHLIPVGHEPMCREGACFAVSCAETEGRFISGLNDGHLKCAKILKGLLKLTNDDVETFARYLSPDYLLGSLIFGRNTESKKRVILDGALNILLMEHTITCNDADNVGGCVQAILRTMQSRLGLPDIPLFTYFKEKKLYSVFFKGHNIFCEEDIGHSTSGLIAAQESLSHVQAHVTETVDDGLGRNRLASKDILQLCVILILLGCPLQSIVTVVLNISILHISPGVFNGVMLASETILRAIRIGIVWTLCKKYFHNFNGILYFRFLFFIRLSGNENAYPASDVLTFLNILFNFSTWNVPNYWVQMQNASCNYRTIAVLWLFSLHTAMGFIVLLRYGKYKNIILLSALYGMASFTVQNNLLKLAFFNYNDLGSHYYYDD